MKRDRWARQRVKVVWEDETRPQFFPQVRGWSTLWAWRYFFRHAVPMTHGVVGFDSMSAAEHFLKNYREPRPPRRRRAFVYPAVEMTLEPLTQEPVAPFWVSDSAESETKQPSKERESETVIDRSCVHAMSSVCAAGSCVWGEPVDEGFFAPVYVRRCRVCGRQKYHEPEGVNVL